MILAHRKQLEAICRQRGADIATVMQCVASQDGDRWTIDETHPAYPRRRAVAMAVPGGAGTELQALIKRYLRIDPRPGCACGRRARLMDERGCGWCRDNLSVIISWLREEHARQRVMIPFSSVAAGTLVQLAIRNARKKGTCR